MVVYQSAVRDGDRVFTSGQLPMKDSQLMTSGKLGGAVSMLSAMSPMRPRRTGSLAKAGNLVPCPSVIGHRSCAGNDAVRYLMDFIPWRSCYGRAGRRSS